VTGRFGTTGLSQQYIWTVGKNLGKPEDIHPCPTIQLTNPDSVTLWNRDLDNDKINDQEIGSSTSQVAQEDLTHFVER